MTNKEGLVSYVKVKGSLGCSDHKMVELSILCGQSRAKNKITLWTSGEQTSPSSHICLVEFHRDLKARGS